MQKGAMIMTIRNGKIILKKRDMSTLSLQEKADIAAFKELKGISKEKIDLNDLRAERMHADIARH